MKYQMIAVPLVCVFALLFSGCESSNFKATGKKQPTQAKLDAGNTGSGKNGTKGNSDESGQNGNSEDKFGDPLSKFRSFKDITDPKEVVDRLIPQCFADDSAEKASDSDEVLNDQLLGCLEEENTIKDNIKRKTEEFVKDSSEEVAKKIRDFLENKDKVGSPGDSDAPGGQMTVEDIIKQLPDNLCKQLFGITSGDCRIPSIEFFGGSFQKGAIEIKNPKTGDFSCPKGFESKKFLDTRVPGETLGISADYKMTSVFLCLVPKSNSISSFMSNKCPEGQALMSFGSKKVCSNMPVVLCKSLGGSLQNDATKCVIPPEKKLFGGMFAVGNEPSGLGTVSASNADNGKTEESFCEHPNPLSKDNTCSCDKNLFSTYSSSNIVEFGGNSDRPVYCLPKEKGSVSFGPAKAKDGCSEPGQRSFTIDGNTECSDVLVRVCKKLAGDFNPDTEKCEFSRKSIFGGSFQIGHSAHQGWPQLSGGLRDKTLPSKLTRQFCEFGNPKLAGQKEKSCSCPSGYKAHAVGLFFESKGSSGIDYDKEFICIKE